MAARKKLRLDISQMLTEMTREQVCQELVSLGAATDLIDAEFTVALVLGEIPGDRIIINAPNRLLNRRRRPQRVSGAI